MSNPLIISNSSVKITIFSSWIMNQNFSGFASKANFAVSSHSNKLDFAIILLTTKNISMYWSNSQKSLPIYLTRWLQKLFTFKYLILGWSTYELSGPLIEKLKIAVNYNSINNLDVSGVPVLRRFPQVCFGSQTKSVQTQTDLSTNVTIERFTNILNG